MFTCKGWNTYKITGLIVSMVIVFILAMAVQEVLLSKNKTVSKTLPHITNNFVGRKDEINELLRKVDFDSTRDKRIINIIGSPGFGKSTLAIKFGHTLTEQGIHVDYINIADFAMTGNTEGSMVNALAQKILGSTRANETTLYNWVTEKKTNIVIILDNCDKLLFTQNDNFKNALLAIVQTFTTIKVIVTSVEIALQGEYFDWFQISEFSNDEAMTFLNQELNSISITLEEKEALVKYTGKVPLALRTVSALLYQPDPPTPVDIIDELKSNPLKLLNTTKLQFEKQMTSLLNVTYSRLDDDLRKAARFLAYFPGSFTGRTAIGVHDATTEQKDSLSIDREVLRALVSHSFLGYDEHTNRYQYHQLIREFLLKIDEYNFKNSFESGFREYFLRQLFNNTRYFHTKYPDSVLFITLERHNIHQLLQELKNPQNLPQSFLLLALDCITQAIDIGYLTSQFSNKALKFFLPFSYTVGLLNSEFHSLHITDLYGNKWTFSEYYHCIAVKVSITFTTLVRIETDFRSLTNPMSIIESLNNTEMIVELLLRNVAWPNLNRLPLCDPKIVPHIPPMHYFFKDYLNDYLYLDLEKSYHHYTQKILENETICDCRHKPCNATYYYFYLGHIHWTLYQTEKAVHYYQLSLVQEKLSPLHKAYLLFTLSLAYRWTKHFPFSVRQTKISEAIKVCKNLMELEDDVLATHHEIVIDLITHVTIAGGKVGFLKERMFTIISSSVPTKLQLEPQTALELLDLVVKDKNATKTIFWGSLLLKPFQHHYNFPIEDQADFLKIRTIVAQAKLFSFEALNDFKSILNDIYNYEGRISQFNAQEKTACFYLIPYGKYLYPCYHESVRNFVNIFLGIYAYRDTVMRVIYSVFIIPEKISSWRVVDGFTTIIIRRMLLSIQYYNSGTTYLSRLLRFTANVLMVWIRLWILYSFFFICIGITLLLTSIYLGNITGKVFSRVVGDPRSSLLQVYCVIVLSEVILYVIKVLITIVRVFNTWGSIWIQGVNLATYPWTRTNLLHIFVAKNKDMHRHAPLRFWIQAVIAMFCINLPGLPVTCLVFMFLHPQISSSDMFYLVVFFYVQWVFYTVFEALNILSILYANICVYQRQIIQL